MTQSHTKLKLRVWDASRHVPLNTTFQIRLDTAVHRRWTFEHLKSHQEIVSHLQGCTSRTPCSPSDCVRPVPIAQTRAPALTDSVHTFRRLDVGGRACMASKRTHLARAFREEGEAVSAAESVRSQSLGITTPFTAANHTFHKLYFVVFRCSAVAHNVTSPSTPHLHGTCTIISEARKCNLFHIQQSATTKDAEY